MCNCKTLSLLYEIVPLGVAQIAPLFKQNKKIILTKFNVKFKKKINDRFSRYRRI